jgi:hypothetical protein
MKKKLAKAKTDDLPLEESVGESASGEAQKQKRNHWAEWQRNNPTRKFSEGIKGTIIAICKYWSRAYPDNPADATFKILPEKRDRALFVENFLPTFERIEEHYPGQPLTTNLEGRIRDILTEAHEIKFYEMRAFAEFVGLPTGVWMLFTNVLSDATQGKSKDDIINLLESSEAAIGALRLYLANELKPSTNRRPEGVRVKKFSDLLFTVASPPSSASVRYKAHLEGLGEMSKAFNKFRRK